MENQPISPSEELPVAVDELTEHAPVLSGESAINEVPAIEEVSVNEEVSVHEEVSAPAVAGDPLATIEELPPLAPPPTLNPSAPRAPRSNARLVMAGLTMLTLIASLGLLLRRVSVDQPAVTPVSVAAPAAGQVIPAEAPSDTVVAPLNQVSFNPGPPAIGADLSAYNAEMTEALRPVVNVEYTDIINDPQPWSSHLFGASDMPASVSAPIDETGQQLCMVSQINLADLPAMPAAEGNASTVASLPRTGVLQFWLALQAPGSAGWTGGPTFAETADNPRQKVTYVSAEDVAKAPAKRLPMAGKCSSGPPAKGPAVTLGMKFSNAWNVPETTDNRFDSSLPQLAGALRSNSDEFYRANGAIGALLGATPAAQIGGFNRLVNQDPRVVNVSFEDEARVGVSTDVYEVLFEVHAATDADDRYNVGFGNEGSGGWWADPKEVARLADPTGVNAGRSGILKSAFWWDGQVAPVAADGQPS
jgi:uncharacterized protein YwqG